MKVEFKASFVKDLRKIKDAQLKKQVLQVIELVEKNIINSMQFNICIYIIRKRTMGN